MASIRKEISIKASPDDVWAAVRDVGAVHRRLAEGFVTDTRLDGDARVVTFANGMVLRELIVDIDDATRRFAYCAYVKLPQDRTVVPAQQDRMIARLVQPRVHEIDAGHLAMLSAPDALSAVLAREAAAA